MVKSIFCSSTEPEFSSPPITPVPGNPKSLASADTHTHMHIHTYSDIHIIKNKIFYKKNKILLHIIHIFVSFALIFAYFVNINKNEHVDDSFVS